MDCLLNNETLSFWLIEYGSIALFILLALGIIALPIPEETLMVLAGVLMYNGKLLIPSTLAAAYGGSICGITTSYILGRTAGHYLLKKTSGWFGFSEKHLQTAHDWFERYGTWTLLFGYFVPGVRHFTGISAGMTELEYNRFALFAYTGAILWASFFLSIGYFFGDHVLALLAKVLDVSDFLTILLVGVAVYLIYYLNKKK